MPQGKGTYGSQVGRPSKKENPRTAAAKRLSARQRSDVVKTAQKGKPMPGKKGPHIGFKGLEKKLTEKGKSPESAAKIAGSVFWKQQAAKRGK
jgi:hypothetical protein